MMMMILMKMMTIIMITIYIDHQLCITFINASRISILCILCM
jgi:hypothetical protein